MKYAFSVNYAGRARVLQTKVKVCTPLNGTEDINARKDLKEYVSIWDTGATHSAITERVVSDLGLKPTGLAEVRHADGKSSVNTYLIGIALPNGLAFSQVRVSQVNLIPDDNQKDEDQPQLLIGMDIIGMGDFAVTNFNGNTLLSFQIPSSERIDFVPKAKMENIIETKKNHRPFKGRR